MKMEQVREQLNNPPAGSTVEILTDTPDRIDAKITMQGKTLRVAYLIENGKVIRHTY